MSKPSHGLVATVLARHFHSTVSLSQNVETAMSSGNQVQINADASNSWEKSRAELKRLANDFSEHSEDFQRVMDAADDVAGRSLTATMSTVMIEQYFLAAGRILSSIQPQGHCHLLKD